MEKVTHCGPFLRTWHLSPNPGGETWVAKVICDKLEATKVDGTAQLKTDTNGVVVVGDEQNLR
jgi:hypothetical protein